MPRLQILQHKSYHPYLESNKQKVRDDEARARLDEELREKADIEDGAGSRLEFLRKKAADPNGEHSYEGFVGTDAAGSAPGPSRLIQSHRKAQAKADKRKEKEIMNFDWPSETKRKEEKRAAKAKAREESGEERREQEEGDKALEGLREGEHLNFWADVEIQPSKSSAPATMGDKLKDQEDKERDPFTMYLGRPDRETKPWYTDKEFKRVEDKADGEEYERRRERSRRKDERAKNRHDPLTTLNSMLAPSKPAPRPASSRRMPPPSATDGDPARAARLAREASERQRALDMIASEEKKKRRVWEETPSSAASATPRSERWDDLERHKDSRYQGPAEMFGRRFMDSMGGRGR